MGIDAAAPRLDVEITPTTPRPGLNGFGFRIREEGLDRFASATSLVVLRGEVVVANLDLTGSSGAVRNLRRCGELVGARVQADRATIERNAYIPADPFAPAEHYASSASDPLAIRWARPPRITERDIPQRAIDAGVTGSAVVECQISDMGRPEYCSVISETPEGYGFGAVALRVVARALASPTNAGRKGRATVQFSRID
ncbi:energy transducer TonB [Brevundimonas sp.]|uniref:energy transducer TonB n=1 Tax=Brevundimonas sp. TaxID=1871086 RepID=UPI0039183A24